MKVLAALFVFASMLEFLTGQQFDGAVSLGAGIALAVLEVRRAINERD